MTTKRTITNRLLLPCGALILCSSGALADSPPDKIELTGVVRDFREWNEPGGHIDFDLNTRGTAWMGGSSGVFVNNIADTLDADGKPTYTGGGRRLDAPATDNSGRELMPGLASTALGDTLNVLGIASNGGITSAASFAQWYRDTPGVNMSQPLTITLHRQVDGTYLFDDKIDPAYSGLGGFFPIDDALFGNPPIKSGVDHNYHFTLELRTRFIYNAGSEQVFKFVGDDDVFVFINGKKVIDLGGIHGPATQHVDVDRIASDPSFGLVDGQAAQLDFFFAERNRVGSNFHVRTNIDLESAAVPSITAAFD